MGAKNKQWNQTERVREEIRHMRGSTAAEILFLKMMKSKDLDLDFAPDFDFDLDLDHRPRPTTTWSTASRAIPCLRAAGGDWEQGLLPRRPRLRGVYLAGTVGVSCGTWGVSPGDVDGEKWRIFAR
jgi:hypothetical protein